MSKPMIFYRPVMLVEGIRTQTGHWCDTYEEAHTMGNRMAMQPVNIQELRVPITKHNLRELLNWGKSTVTLQGVTQRTLA